MQSNRSIVTTFLAVFVMAASPAAQASITLSTFGDTLEADVWSYDPATSTISGTDGVGALLFPPTFAPVDLTILGSPNTLSLSLTGFVTTAPVGAFTITLEDNAKNLSVTGFAWNAFSTTSSTVQVALGVPATFNWDNVIAWTLDAGGSGGPVNATFTELTVVPEPSTYALLAMGSMALGGYFWRRRR